MSTNFSTDNETVQNAAMYVVYIAANIIEDLAVMVAGLDCEIVAYSDQGRPLFVFEDKSSPEFGRFWRSLVNTALPDGIIIGYNKEQKSMSFDAMDHLYPAISAILELYNGPSTGHQRIIKETRNFSTIRPDDLCLLPEEKGYVGQKGLEGAFLRAQQARVINPILGFRYKPLDLLRATQATNIAIENKETSHLASLGIH